MVCIVFFGFVVFLVVDSVNKPTQNTKQTETIKLKRIKETKTKEKNKNKQTKKPNRNKTQNAPPRRPFFFGFFRPPRFHRGTYGSLRPDPSPSNATPSKRDEAARRAGPGDSFEGPGNEKNDFLFLEISIFVCGRIVFFFSK